MPPMLGTGYGETRMKGYGFFLRDVLEIIPLPM